MADFKQASLWMKLALIFSVLSFLKFHIACLMSGWGPGDGGTLVICSGNSCSDNWYVPTRFCMVVAFAAHTAALILCLCIVLMDEVNSKKPAKISFIVFAFAAGLLILAGLIAFTLRVNNTTYSPMMTVLASLLVLLAGIFGVLDLVGVKA